MNRNLDGSVLTREDMTAIAIEHGIADEATVAGWFAHGFGLGISRLSTATAKVRHRMFLAGQLRLDTRTPSNSPPDPRRS